jgi:hypothetical protein
MANDKFFLLSSICCLANRTYIIQQCSATSRRWTELKTDSRQRTQKFLMVISIWAKRTRLVTPHPLIVTPHPLSYAAPSELQRGYFLGLDAFLLLTGQDIMRRLKASYSYSVGNPVSNSKPNWKPCFLLNFYFGRIPLFLLKYKSLASFTES